MAVPLFVSSGSATLASSNTVLNIPITTKSGNVTVVWVLAEGAGNTVSSVTDTAGNEWEFVAAVRPQAAHGFECWVQRTQKITTTQVTVTTAVAGNITAVVCEYSGVSNIGKTAAPTTATSTAPSISILTSLVDSMVAAGVAYNDLGAFTATSGTARASQSQAGVTMTITGMDNTSSPVATVTDSGTIASAEWSMIAVELLALIVVAAGLPNNPMAVAQRMC